MQVNSVQSTAFNSFRNNVQNGMAQSSQRLAGGRRINSAADDAAGLGIASRMQAQIGGLNQGNRNAADMDSALRTADGTLSTITESLQRVRELAVQAASPIMSDADRALIQTEVNQHLNQIQRAAGDTQFNTMRLLDGSFADMHMASNPNGSGMQISIANTSLETLGIDSFDVTSGRPDIAAIDDALAMVSSNRADIGAVQNRIEYIMDSNSIASLNQAAAQSRIADADMALEAMMWEQQQVLQQYQIFSMREQMERSRESLGFVGISW